MRTLFSENILSPLPPSPIDTLQHTHSFELCFQSSSSTTNASLIESPPSSLEPNDLLTYQIQTRQRLAGEVKNDASENAAQRFAHLSRRKGNPRVLLMGLRRSGKSSIQKVIFEKLWPAETLYLESTTQMQTTKMESFINFESVDIPSNLSLTSPDFEHEMLGSAGAVIWVLDMQDEYYASIEELVRTAVFLLENHPRMHFEVFIHKTDGLSEEYKRDTFRDVRQRVQDELADAGYTERGVAFYQTSVFDHSVYEAMSRVVQKLLPELPAMEALLNRLCSACRIQKAYLFDTASKIYLATDASPSFLRDYEVCADYVDAVIDIKQIYGWRARVGGGGGDATPPPSSTIAESLVSHDKTGNTYMYAREISDSLTLICLMGQGSTPDRRVLIDYNVGVLHDALRQIFKV